MICIPRTVFCSASSFPEKGCLLLIYFLLHSVADQALGSPLDSPAERYHREPGRSSKETDPSCACLFASGPSTMSHLPRSNILSDLLPRNPGRDHFLLPMNIRLCTSREIESEGRALLAPLSELRSAVICDRSSRSTHFSAQQGKVE